MDTPSDAMLDMTEFMAVLRGMFQKF